jgi:hypothetical protein
MKYPTFNFLFDQYDSQNKEIEKKVKILKY